jgi:hypothetical protein
MPAILEEQEHVLRVRQERERRDFVRQLARILARQGQTSLVARRIQPDPHLRVADVREHRDEHRPRVLNHLARLPLSRRHGRIVVVGPHPFVVSVEEVHEHPVVLVESGGVGGDLELVGHLDRAAERRTRTREADRGRGHGRTRRLAAAAGGYKRANQQRKEQS